MTRMFACAHAFSGDLRRWDLSSVTEIEGMLVSWGGLPGRFPLLNLPLSISIEEIFADEE